MQGHFFSISVTSSALPVKLLPASGITMVSRLLFKVFTKYLFKIQSYIKTVVQIWLQVFCPILLLCFNIEGCLLSRFSPDHETIWPGITCQKTSLYMCDWVCRWLNVKNEKILNKVMRKVFEIFRWISIGLYI